ncbi:MAG TPA: OmpA family protein [Myxococcota bacterium]|nr:OmpA family protein [Myxococcota bacterium]
MLKLRTLAAPFPLLVLAAALGCAPGQPLDTKTKQGAVIGTLAGAATGAAVGGKEHRAGGALIGAAAGAVAGGLIGNYLDKQAQELDAIPGADVTRKDDALLVSLQGGVLYDSNSAQLSPGGAERIRSLARTVQSYPKERIIVKGHTDSQGDERANQRLSEDRADSVRNMLIAEGVSPARITAVGLGASLPVATNSTPEGRQQNRRVEIELRPDAEVLQGEASQ